jgi:hypothetical protein
LQYNLLSLKVIGGIIDQHLKIGAVESAILASLLPANLVERVSEGQANFLPHLPTAPELPASVDTAAGELELILRAVLITRAITFFKIIIHVLCNTYPDLFQC